jgi:chemotaxis protein methyltransferase CheR
MVAETFDFTYLCHLVQQHSGVVLEPHKDYLATLYLSNLVSQNGFESLAQFVEHLQRQSFGELHRQTIEALLINETSFFRDSYPFETLRAAILPELLQSRSIEKSLNIWCAACSTGQEPYSIAILIREDFPELQNWKIRIIASDLSQRALTRAQRGQYTNLEVGRGLSPALRDRYFYKTHSSWHITSDIQRMVEFQQLNLIHDWQQLPKLDIIFLRNVLIYFEIETKQKILSKVREYLRSDGYLFLGGGETTLQLDPEFEVVQRRTALYHRLREK